MTWEDDLEKRAERVRERQNVERRKFFQEPVPPKRADLAGLLSLTVLLVSAALAGLGIWWGIRVWWMWWGR